MSTSSHIAVIGGGAAGFFAAITAKRTNPNATVIIYEKTGKVLAKVGVSGGGRCNLTNSFANIKDLKHVYPRGHKLMKRLFKQFDYKEVYQWFEDNGVELVTQADQCVFPKAQNSQAIIECLTNEAKKLGIKILLHHCLSGITPLEEGRLKVSFANQPAQQFDKVIITTGGSPLLKGLQHHAQTGHEIIEPAPSLFTLSVEDKAFTDLMGIVVDPVSLSIPSTKFKSEGALLITHWGMSGPATLKLSSYAARYLHEHKYKVNVAINWINETNAAIVEQQLTKMIQLNQKKQMAGVVPYQLTTRVWQYLLERAGLDSKKRWEELGRKGMNKLIETLTNDVHNIQGKGRFKDEFVTCGGISLQSITPRTLESKVCRHLYFAGEVLDIDGITGGFNLQAAWTTGYVAGKAAAESFSI
ncbi:NAD(P)/FAD-dependent oxidoreductase [Prevotella sp. A2931]|uniref:NAD(P)/FAD-dependent oxidoreductase n=1 Tax=Prevotella illustrans TaxID=2800387 RepID=A0ABS3M3B3_9BACT|nr:MULTISPECIES: NAD(P)/FAD-dependent oxidoreductase [Prevotella]MBO1362652.1 NAD(P)/FAD-dependent oxidoreductase [Prevotella illustrans]PTL25178.1 aminoacetone oxidase family FAD-binding enzyme [Prevotella sp. oral taxon 820]